MPTSTTTQTIVYHGAGRPRVLVQPDGPEGSVADTLELFELLIPGALDSPRTGLSAVTMLGLYFAVAMQDPGNQRKRLVGEPIVIPRPAWLGLFGGKEQLDANHAVTEALDRKGYALNQEPGTYYVTPR